MAPVPNYEKEEEFKHNNLERKELGNLSLAEIKEMNPTQVQSMINQSRVIGHLQKHSRKKDKDFIPDVDEVFDEESSDDQEEALHEFDASARDQFVNKKIFRKNYGIEAQFPCMYIMDSKVVPNDLSMMVRVVKYVAPDYDKIRFKEYKATSIPELNETVPLGI